MEYIRFCNTENSEKQKQKDSAQKVFQTIHYFKYCNLPQM